MDERCSICTLPDLRERSLIPVRSFSMSPFRILSLSHPISCGYSASYLRKPSASLRRASVADAARDAARLCPSGTAPGKKR
jgi:hypothetical protein